MALSGIVAEAGVSVVPITGGFASKLNKDIKDAVDDATKESSGAFDKLANLGKQAVLGLGAAAVSVGVEAVHLADQYEAAHARLETAITNSGHSFEEFSGTVNKQVQSFAGLGYSATQYQDALATLTQATKDPTTALGDMGVVADLAAAKHMDLNSAATLVGKVVQGNSSILKRYGIDLGTANSGVQQLQKAQQAAASAQNELTKAEQRDTDAKANLASVQAKVNDGHLKGQQAADALRKAHEAVANADDAVVKAHQKVADANTRVQQTASGGAAAVAALGERFAGNAANQADTFSGKVKALEATVQNLGIRLGLWLVPKLEEAAKVTVGVINWFEHHRLIAEALGIAIGVVLVTAIGAYVVSMAAAAVVTLSAISPLAGLLIPIAALALGIYELATHWQQVWSDIKQWTADAVNWVRDHIYVLLGAGPIGALAIAAIELATHWQDVWNAIKTVTDAVVNWLVGEFHIFQAIVTPIWQAISDVILFVWRYLDVVIRAIWTLLRDWLVLEWRIFVAVVTVAWNLIAGPIKEIWAGIDAAIRGMWTGIKTFLTLEWTAFLAVAKFSWGLIVGAVTDAWHVLETAAQDVWDKVKGIFDGGINLVIGALNGFIHAINAVTGLFQIPKIPDIPSVGGGGGGGSGGGGHAVAAAMGMVTQGPVIAGEAGTEVIVPLDPRYRGRALQLTSYLLDALGLPKMAGGGIVGDVVGAVSGAVGSAANVVGNVIGAAENAVKNTVLGPIRDTAKAAINALPVPDLLKEIADGVIDKIFGAAKVRPQATGGGGGGPLVGDPGNIGNPLGFAVALLNTLGDPLTPANLHSLVDWEALEGGQWANSAHFNPLNTTWRMPGSTSMNSVGVQAYLDWQQGLSATINTLQAGYGDILAAFASGQGLTRPLAGLSKWSGGGYSQVFDTGGWLAPGVTVAVNNTGLPERVIGPTGGTGTLVAQGAIQQTFVVSGQPDELTLRAMGDIAEAHTERALTIVLDRISARRPGGH